MTSCVYLCGCVIYWFFASGELQPWAKENHSDNEDEEVKNQNGIKINKEHETTKF